MIITLTPNPAVDRTLSVERLVPGAVHRAVDHQVEPSGKGINVSRALVRNGVPSRAVFPAGGGEGAQLTALLDEEGVGYDAMPIAEAIRVNVSFVSADGLATKVNEAGPRLSAEESDELLRLLGQCLSRVDAPTVWVVASGTLAPGMPVDFYAAANRIAQRYGARLALDTSGPPLQAALEAGPDVLKPNVDELAELVGAGLGSLGEVLAAACEVRRRTGGTVLVSLGADGAVLVDADGALHAEAKVDGVRSAVGAGDNLLAGYVAARAADPDARVGALREAVAWGAVAVRSAGSLAAPVRSTDRASVAVHDPPDPTRRLSR